MRALDILLLSPFDGGSHRDWAEGLARHSRHRVRIWRMPGRHWKWRMHGAAVQFATRYAKTHPTCDLVLATDMMDLAVFRGLLPSPPPTALYFHENQITYPWKERAAERARDRHYGFINWTSAQAADAVFFNSAFHRDEFCDALGPWLGCYPDAQGVELVSSVRAKSEVLYPGVSVAPRGTAVERAPGPLRILWNHRWEYDKDPEGFVAVLEALMAQGRRFEVAVLGASFSSVPDAFSRFRERLGNRLVQFGFVADRSRYQDWLRWADVLPVTARQEFFGISVAEAAAAGVWPVLPRRLSYPELWGDTGAPFYDEPAELCAQLAAWSDAPPATRFDGRCERLSWATLAPAYDAALAAVLGPAAERRGTGARLPLRPTGAGA